MNTLITKIGGWGIITLSFIAFYQFFEEFNFIYIVLFLIPFIGGCYLASKKTENLKR